MSESQQLHNPQNSSEEYGKVLTTNTAEQKPAANTEVQTPFEQTACKSVMSYDTFVELTTAARTRHLVQRHNPCNRKPPSQIAERLWHQGGGLEKDELQRETTFLKRLDQELRKKGYGMIKREKNIHAQLIVIPTTSPSSSA